MLFNFHKKMLENSNKMIRVGIVGASGYTGGELLRFLSTHPQVEMVAATSRRFDGNPIHKVHPNLRDIDLKFENLSLEDIDADLVFTATPHGASLKIVPKLIENNVKVIDLSGDYRFNDLEVYEKWYGYKHEKMLKATYGLPELYRDEIKEANLIANPGCFPTGGILASYPLVSEKLVDTIIIDSKTGISGAGVKPTEATHYPNCSDNVGAYSVTTHRHMPEIQEKFPKRVK